MKSFFFILVFFYCNLTFAQLSLFKDINLLESGSNPRNFVEVNGIVFFTTKTTDGLLLWKTDGTPNGTVQVTNQLLWEDFTNPKGGQSLSVFNNEIYYFVKTNIPTNQTQLWKTNGITNELVLDNFSIVNLFFFNNQICYFSVNKLFKISSNSSVLLNTFDYQTMFINPVVANNNIYYFEYKTIGSETFPSLHVWKSDGSIGGNQMISSIDSLAYQNYSSSDITSIEINNIIYFVIKRYRFNNNYNTNAELWKIEGDIVQKVKEIFIFPNIIDYSKPYDLANFNNKLILNYNNQNLWISDGTPNGTILLKSFNLLKNDFYKTKWGFLGNKFYFGASENGDDELWVSDGTVVGTSLLKNINTTSSSSPAYFQNGDSKLFFKANSNEMWETDGTTNGTVFNSNILYPPNTSNISPILPEFIYTTTNQFISKKYTPQNGFELWQSSTHLQNSVLLKNINVFSEGSLASSINHKIGNTWYFNATDSLGSELWKSDGTTNGTVMVKDLNIGGVGINIKEMASVGGILYFTGNFTNDFYTTKLYRSDGTASGTYEIPLPQVQGFPANPYKLIATTDKIYFLDITYRLWVSDGSFLGTSVVVENEQVRDLESVANTLFFTTSNWGLWKTNGNSTELIRFQSVIYYDITSLNGKLYYFSNSALYESDGTTAGTRLIKTLDIGNSKTLQEGFTKTSNRIYFRINDNSSTDINNKIYEVWSTNGTTEGTIKTKTILMPANAEFTYASNDTILYLLIRDRQVSGKIYIWVSDGTEVGTQKIFEQNAYFNYFYSPIAVGEKIYFITYSDNNGFELWRTNGTNAGTIMIGEVRSGAADSKMRNIMNFEDKLLFWAEDITHGFELWQFSIPVCLNNINYNIKSGNWDDPNLWSCERVPQNTDNVIIKANTAVTIPYSLRASAKTILTEAGAYLNSQYGATISIKPD